MIKASDFKKRHCPPEDKVYEAVAEYLKKVWPMVLYHFDFGSGLKMGWAKAKQQKRLQSEQAWPDLAILKPIGRYHGLFIEIKKEDVVVFKKDGTLRSNEHLQEQYECILQLRMEGYAAKFAIGTDDVIKTIENYFAGKEILD